jgi:hypothetical protein
MPLRDHREILTDETRPWVGFHGMWATCLLQRLNLEQLSCDYCASLDVHNPLLTFPQFEMKPNHVVETEKPDSGFPPLPEMSVSASFDEPRSMDVTIEYGGERRVVASVVFAHRGFTETPSGRRAFAIKCAQWLQRGVSVVALNTDNPADVHGDLTALLKLPTSIAWRSPTDLSVVAYRPHGVEEFAKLDVWTYPLAVGESLPTVPLWLEPDLAIPLDLEATYEAACKSLRIE